MEGFLKVVKLIGFGCAAIGGICTAITSGSKFATEINKDNEPETKEEA